MIFRSINNSYLPVFNPTRLVTSYKPTKIIKGSPLVGSFAGDPNGSRSKISKSHGIQSQATCRTSAGAPSEQPLGPYRGTWIWTWRNFTSNTWDFGRKLMIQKGWDQELMSQIPIAWLKRGVTNIFFHIFSQPIGKWWQYQSLAQHFFQKDIAGQNSGPTPKSIQRTGAVLGHAINMCVAVCCCAKLKSK